MINIAHGTEIDNMVIPVVTELVGLRPEALLPAVSIGVFQDNELACGVVYNCYQNHSIAATIACRNKSWATKRVLAELFAYPFLYLGVTRLWVQANRKNRKSRKLAEQMGFVYEGMARKAWDGINDAAIYGMLANECKWLKWHKPDNM